jgi:vacuolar-type H+-ATPase subunit I/STV1
MRRFNNVLLVMILMACLISTVSCQKETEPPAEVTQEELSASVPELSELHEVVYPLWHTAFPDKDFALIKELLREKQTVWNEGKQALKSTLEQLHQATDEDNQEDMLKQTEAFHSAYESLVRTIRPLVTELDAFHQELYKLYHYHAPNEDLEAMRVTVAAMVEKIVPLKSVQLPTRLAERQVEFDEAVGALDSELNLLAEVVQTNRKKEIAAAVEKVHTAYQNTEKIFN